MFDGVPLGDRARRRSRRSARRRGRARGAIVAAGLDAGDVRADALGRSTPTGRAGSSSTASTVRAAAARRAQPAERDARDRRRARVRRRRSRTPRAGIAAMPVAADARARASRIGGAPDQRRLQREPRLGARGARAARARRRRPPARRGARHHARARAQADRAARRDRARGARRRRSSWSSASASSPTRWRASRPATRASSRRRPGVELWPRLRRASRRDAVILLKGSRGVRLERLVPLISRLGVRGTLTAARDARPRSTNRSRALLPARSRSSPYFGALRDLQLHHVPRGRRGGHGAAAQLRRRAARSSAAAHDCAMHQVVREGTPDSHAAKGDDADDGRADHPVLGARPDAALGARSTTATCCSRCS